MHEHDVVLKLLLQGAADRMLLELADAPVEQCTVEQCMHAAFNQFAVLPWSQNRLAEVLSAKPVTITAKYEEGVFKPLEEVTINEGTIVEVRVPTYADHLKRKSRSVQDFVFYGMWKDRTDIGDSVEYISNLRRNLRG
jgi:predicted DNA-binding antitoxin AbrB/MazE fold protein